MQEDHLTSQAHAPKGISLIGSTGSIGKQTLEIARAHKNELTVVALAAGSKNLQLLAQQINEFKPAIVSVPTEKDAEQLKGLVSNASKLTIMSGEEGLIACAEVEEAKTLVTGVVGFLGLKPTVAAVRKGKTIALANKETLVAAGVAIMPLLKQYKASIVPVDSEHSAIFQSLSGYCNKDLSAIWLTASGGPFRTWSKEEIANATTSDALRHPNWNMGPKITVDSATLMNKGLEVIEARWLFDVRADQVKVVIHPQSVLHSAVEFVDGSIVGQLGQPDMRLPIHFALFYPERRHSSTVPRLDLTTLSQLTFEKPDLERFPCLKLAIEVSNEENTLPCALNAANEVVVAAFLAGHVKFNQIAEHIGRVLEKHKAVGRPDFDDILEADRWARSKATEMLALRA